MAKKTQRPCRFRRIAPGLEGRSSMNQLIRDDVLVDRWDRAASRLRVSVRGI
jgi:hypothetical protein